MAQPPESGRITDGMFDFGEQFGLGLKLDSNGWITLR